MQWYIPVLLHTFTSKVLHPVFVKRAANARAGRATRLVWQYLIAALVAVGTAVAIRGTDIISGGGTVVMLVIGAFNAFACYCQWRAVAISQSETSMFTQADDLIAMALGYVILGEHRLLSPLLGTGILLVLVAAIAISYIKRLTNDNSVSKNEGVLKWVALYSMIWGVAIFSKRYFALAEMPLVNYLAAWYVGSVFGALLTWAKSGKEEREQQPTKEILTLSAPVALSAWFSNVLSYWCLQILPITIYQPIDQVSEMIFPTLIGLYWFKEKDKQFKDNRYKLAMGAGLLGGIIVVLSYSF